LKHVALAVGAAVAAVALLSLVGLPFGISPRLLLSVLYEGSIGSSFAISATIIKMVPLLLTGLSVVIAFRAGVWNIGAEGQFIVGAIAALVFAPAGIVIALVAAMIGGAIWSSIASAMRLWRNAPEVLSTILLNFVALHLLGWVVNGPLQESSEKYPQTDVIPDAAWLRTLGSTDVHSGIVIALAVAALAWWLLYGTREGLRVRATGFNPSAARWAGINVNAQIVRAMAMSGAVAGLAGGIELCGVTHRLFERFAAGYGYSGIAVALLAGLHPGAATIAAFFFGAMASGAGELQRAGFTASVASVAQAIVILTLIAFGRFHARD
jgi:simple sugar transport system permease protein